ncbi:23.6 kDa heat shock protein, mitochondrial-like isoform X2 [Tripterygium wilfordii]|uniref:23.6 kDa heat shock protein, mitochondrial-like isoform X2 n=1 Tax=Tripterygium wilfordii TaxID=458696 RepID=UPI0018F7EE7B|nr:23.6 kDa heat shock protein, mitochondrial-like isoform X2 [Tripterygium wilfordii]
MASFLALRRLVSSNSLPSSQRVIRPVTTTPSATRLFNTNAVREFDDDDDERCLDSGRRSGRSVSRRGDDFFSDVFGLPPTRSVSQVLNLMDQFMDNPFLSASRGLGSGIRHGWDARETDDALHFRVDMPGLGKEDVKVAVEQNTLIIKGEGEAGEGEESGRRYSSRIDLPEKIYQTDQIKAEMKNGVLKVIVPKLKAEERTDVFNIKVE